MKRLVAACSFAVLVAVACSSGGPSAGEARLVVFGGTATVTDADGEATIVTGSETLRFGDTVTLDAGTATLELAGGAVYELRAGAPGTRLVVASPPELLAGDLLISDGFPAGMVHQGATVTSTGSTQLDAEDRVVSVYVGRTDIEGVAGLTEVFALREAVLAPSIEPVPLDYDPADDWDRRYLAQAVAFGDRLEALARGITADLRPGLRGADFYEDVVPALGRERGFDDSLIEVGRPVGETIVGASIAVEGRQETFEVRWRAIFQFRDAGARWGLVALDQGVSEAPVLDTIELAIADDDLSAPPRTTTTSTFPTTTSTTTTTSDGSTTTTSTTTTTMPPDDTEIPPILDPVLDLLDDLLGGESVLPFRPSIIGLG